MDPSLNIQGKTLSAGYYCRRLLLLPLLMLLSCGKAGAGWFDFSDDDPLLVEIADPYIELHTGDGEGYPVFFVEEQGEQIEILKRRTDWFKVRTANGKEGWVPRLQLERTLAPGGGNVDIRDATQHQFAFHRWEMGAMGGDYEGADVMTAYGGYFFAPKLSAELSVSRVFSAHSDADMLSASVLIHPFPEWRISPFFGVGTGLITRNPDTTLVQENDSTDQLGHAGLGLRIYLARRFIFRAQYTNYVIFQSQDDNQEIDEWKAGFAVFF